MVRHVIFLPIAVDVERAVPVSSAQKEFRRHKDLQDICCQWFLSFRRSTQTPPHTTWVFLSHLSRVYFQAFALFSIFGMFRFLAFIHPDNSAS